MLLAFYADAFLLGAATLQALGFALLGLLVLAGFLHHAEHGEAGATRLGTVLQAALAALSVLVLSRSATIGVVSATALVGCLGGLLELAGRQRWNGLGAAVYCGAFAGMTSERVLGHPGWVLLAGATAGLLLQLLRNSWSGIGGKLGSTAFLAVIGACGLAIATGSIGPGAQLHAFSPPERAAALAAALLSPLCTYQLSHPWKLGVVLGSALPSLLAGLLLPAPLAGVWLGASFVGMTAPERLAPHPRPTLVAMGLLFCLFILSFEPTLAGVGGDLGATAAVSVFAVLGLLRLTTAIRRSLDPSA